MKLFLCCPICLTASYRHMIKLVKDVLEFAGYTVVNPLDLYDINQSKKVFINELKECDAVAVYGKYETSKNCQYFLDIAFELKLKINSVNTWLEYKQLVSVDCSSEELLRKVYKLLLSKGTQMDIFERKTRLVTE